MNREAAESKAIELNRELGERGDDVSFYVAVETGAGDWQVEKRTEHKSLLKRIIDALLNAPGP